MKVKLNSMAIGLCASVCAAIVFTSLAVAAGSQQKVQIVKPEAHGISLPMRELAAPQPGEIAPAGSASVARVVSAPATANPPAKPSSNDPVVQTTPEPLSSTITEVSFNGLAAIPGDEPALAEANGAAGATQFVEAVNDSYAVYDKTTGNLLAGPVPIWRLFKAIPGNCGKHLGINVNAQYDKLAGRWVLNSHVQLTSGYLQCIAVSQTSDATGSYYLYSFNLSPNRGQNSRMGLWSDAYYLAGNELNPTTNKFITAVACAFDRNAMLTGAIATSVCINVGGTYRYLMPSDLDGTTAPPTGSPNYYMNLAKSALDIWQFHVDFTNPTSSTLTGPTAVTVASYSNACPGSKGVCIPQQNSTQLLNSVTGLLLYRLAYRNLGTYESLLVSHTVNPPTAAYAGVRWYEVRSPGSAPTLYQQGTFSPDGTSRWVSSIAQDKLGNIAVGYSVSSSSVNPGIAYAVRVPSDPLGTLETETTALAGPGAQQPKDDVWGDYSSMAVDPTDDCTFWYTNEYLPSNGTNNWATYISSFKIAGCM
jgi:hypothetical protein